MQLTKLVYILPLVVSALAAAVPEAKAEAEPVELSVNEALDVFEKRSCTYNGCKCTKGTKAGVYCGWCGAITAAGTGGSWSDVYQCASSGDCCRYGARASCVNPASYSPCG
ncbi:hypothetical protein AA313_de0206920 [Arthrobotrys entomopaga]|nr:hypothetical protein AA313_de0206920 [Arthrobotrys entomopaga]